MDVFLVGRTDDKDAFCCDFESCVVVAENEADAIAQVIAVDSFTDRGVEPDGANLFAGLLAGQGRGIIMTRLNDSDHH